MTKNIITGPTLNRALKLNNIQQSVFAFRGRIRLDKIRKVIKSKAPVPDYFIRKLKLIFNVDITQYQ